MDMNSSQKGLICGRVKDRQNKMTYKFRSSVLNSK
jgi:hypothetical protein